MSPAIILLLTAASPYGETGRGRPSLADVASKAKSMPNSRRLIGSRPGRGPRRGEALTTLAAGCAFAYLVPSYSDPLIGPARLAATDCVGSSVCAAVKRENFFGVLFLPKKSGAEGLAILDALVA